MRSTGGFFAFAFLIGCGSADNTASPIPDVDAGGRGAVGGGQGFPTAGGKTQQAGGGAGETDVTNIGGSATIGNGGSAGAITAGAAIAGSGGTTTGGAAGEADGGSAGAIDVGGASSAGAAGADAAGGAAGATCLPACTRAIDPTCGPASTISACDPAPFGGQCITGARAGAYALSDGIFTSATIEARGGQTNGLSVPGPLLGRLVDLCGTERYVFGDYNGGITAMDPTTPSIAWTWTPVAPSAAPIDGAVIDAAGHILYARQLPGGTQTEIGALADEDAAASMAAHAPPAWTFTVDGAAAASPILLPGGRLFVATDGDATKSPEGLGHLYEVDVPADGSSPGAPGAGLALGAGDGTHGVAVSGLVASADASTIFVLGSAIDHDRSGTVVVVNVSAAPALIGAAPDGVGPGGTDYFPTTTRGVIVGTDVVALRGTVDDVYQVASFPVTGADPTWSVAFPGTSPLDPLVVGTDVPRIVVADRGGTVSFFTADGAADGSIDLTSQLGASVGTLEIAGAAIDASGHIVLSASAPDARAIAGKIIVLSDATATAQIFTSPEIMAFAPYDAPIVRPNGGLVVKASDVREDDLLVIDVTTN